MRTQIEVVAFLLTGASWASNTTISCLRYQAPPLSSTNTYSDNQTQPAWEDCQLFLQSWTVTDYCVSTDNLFGGWGFRVQTAYPIAPQHVKALSVAALADYRNLPESVNAIIGFQSVESFANSSNPFMSSSSDKPLDDEDYDFLIRQCDIGNRTGLPATLSILPDLTDFDTQLKISLALDPAVFSKSDAGIFDFPLISILSLAEDLTDSSDTPLPPALTQITFNLTYEKPDPTSVNSTPPTQPYSSALAQATNPQPVSTATVPGTPLDLSASTATSPVPL